MESASKQSTYGKSKMLSDFSKSRELISRISTFNNPSTASTASLNSSSSSVNLVRMKTKPMYPNWDQIKKESQELLDHPLLLCDSTL